MEKIWLKSYEPGVPAEIDPDIYQSIPEIFAESCSRFAGCPAFYSMGVTITYEQLDQYSRNFAAFLQQELKLVKGERLAIMLPNILQYPIALFGGLRAGLAIVNVNPLYTADELTAQLNNAGAKALIVLESFAHTVQQALPNMPSVEHVIVTKLGDMFPFMKSRITQFFLKYIYKKIPDYSLPKAMSFEKAMRKAKMLRFVPVEINNQDIAFLQYTGGTTGISKGAILTHRNIVANMVQARAWLKSLLIDKQEIIITALPLYHIFSLTANCLCFSNIGGLNVLIANPRDIPAMIKDMGKFKFTAVTGVNTLFNALLKNPKFAKLDFSALRLSLGGGMAVQRVVAEKWQRITCAPLLEAYGLTETSPCVTINPTYLKSYNGTIGLPVSSTDVCFFDDDGHEVPLGHPGELAIKGPQVMRGYWQNQEETDKVFHDGWLLTGDIASMDENGFVKILERKKDMILVSGFNVYPNEVEDVIARMEGVREVAVIGVADENSGEAVKAFIVSDDPNLTSDKVIAQAREHLTGYKVPKYIEFRGDLPKTAVGKILRRALRADIKIPAGTNSS